MLSRLYTIYKFSFFLLQPYVDYFCYNNDELCIMKWYKTIAVRSPVLLFWFWPFKYTLRKNGQQERIKLCCSYFREEDVCNCLQERQRKEDCLLLAAFAAAQAEVTRGLTVNNDGDARFAGVWLLFQRGCSQPTLRQCVPCALVNIRNKMQRYVTASWGYKEFYSFSTLF